MNIHSSAIVHPKANVGEDVVIGPYCVVGEHVTIGDQTELLPHVCIEGHTEIGRCCRISPLYLLVPHLSICNIKMNPRKSVSGIIILFGKM